MRNTVSCKNLAMLLLVIMAFQCFPQVAMGYDISAKIKAFTSSQVKESDKIIDSNYTKVKKSVGQGIGKIEHKVLDGFSMFENKTGLNQQNWLYGRTKNNVLEGVGIGLGLTKGVTDISLDAYSLIAKVPTLPERTINFAYNYTEDPKKYQNKVTSGLKVATDVAQNPLPLLYRMCQYGKNTYTQARKSPLEYGKLEGEIIAVVGSFFVGGTQIKALTTANKAEKAVKISTVSKRAGPLFSFKKNRLSKFVDNEKVTLESIKLNCVSEILPSNANKKLQLKKEIINSVTETTGNKYKKYEKLLAVAEVYGKPIEEANRKFERLLLRKSCWLVRGRYDRVEKLGIVSLPMKEEFVRLVAKAAGADLKGVKIDIRSIDRFSGKKLVNAEANVNMVTGEKNLVMFPHAFKTSIYALAETIGHESVHFSQLELVGKRWLKLSAPKQQALMEILEREAYGGQKKYQLHFLTKMNEYRSLKRGSYDTYERIKIPEI